MRRVHPRTDIMPFPGPRYGGVGRASPEPQANNAGVVDTDRVCMCGALDRDHSAYDGHAFVDMEEHLADSDAERWAYSQGHAKGFAEGGRIERERADFLEAELEKVNATLLAERTAREAAECCLAEGKGRLKNADDLPCFRSAEEAVAWFDQICAEIDADRAAARAEASVFEHDGNGYQVRKVGKA